MTAIEVKYYDNHENGNGISKAAFTLTWMQAVSSRRHHRTSG